MVKHLQRSTKRSVKRSYKKRSVKRSTKKRSVKRSTKKRSKKRSTKRRSKKRSTKKRSKKRSTKKRSKKRSTKRLVKRGGGAKEVYKAVMHSLDEDKADVSLKDKIKLEKALALARERMPNISRDMLYDTYRDAKARKQ